MKTLFNHFKLLGTIGLFYFINIIQVTAATVTWNGGNGDWNIAANWNTGAIPGINDEIEIPNGVVFVPAGYTAQAIHINIHSPARLQIRQNGLLRVANAIDKAGIKNSGKLLVFGSLSINNIKTVRPTQAVNGISNDNYLYVGTKGKIIIEDVSNSGIYMANSSAKLTNYGLIFIDDCDDHGLFSFGNNHNYGIMTITHTTQDTKVALNLFGKFKNYEEGTIELFGGHKGISLVLPTTVFKNWGTINSADAGYSGISNNGIFTNYDPGFITTKRSGFFSLYNNETGEFYNEGYCRFYSGPNHGIGNKGMVDNDNSIHIGNAISAGIYSFSGSTFHNRASLFFLPVQNININIEGDFVNYNDGFVTSQNQLLVKSNGSISNEGVWWNKSINNHTLTAGGVFTNDGAIIDLVGLLSLIVTNQQVIVSPLSAVLQNGVPFTPALDVVATDKVTLYSDWYTDLPNTIDAGTYDEATNIFTPGINSVGATTLFLGIGINGTGNSVNAQMFLDNPIAVIGKNPSNAMQFREGAALENETPAAETFSIFPNPSNGLINIKGEQKNNAAIFIHVRNIHAQMVYQQQFDQDRILELNLPHHLGTGTYFINIFREGSLVAVKKIQVNRE